MNAKEKAWELFYEFYNHSTDEYECGMNADLARKCAFTCVLAMIDELQDYVEFTFKPERLEFLNDVKQEIIKIK